MIAKIKNLPEFKLKIAQAGYSERKFSKAIGRCPTFIHIITRAEKTSIPSAYTISKKLKIPFEELFDLVPRE